MGSRSLGPRLTAISQHINICIDNIVNQPRDLHLWDCCCDHGFLGRSFLSQPSLHTVHFVDRISSIMQQLDTKLAADCLPDQQARAQTHIGCAADITLDTQAQHIVVLAGIGGNTLIELLDGIYQRHNASEQQIIFALCPNYHCYDVRRYLQQQYFELISEAYIQDRNKSHEIMLVGSAY
ncbi:MAG: tRNA (adenine(22)-N(1))-methyltransferase TrmK [Pseudomonadales bacterium]|nr:tRNA (adenine(22)-N(1))-methyltransferase TrmK [Pseudomonadales bacterium]